MRMYDIIVNKRNGGILSKEEIDFFVKGYTDGSIPDYQASALMMAIYFKGMTKEETANLTSAMSKSGSVVDLSQLGSLSVDKHSTGGVGDKTSLIVVPIVSSCGCKVAKMSGRGLGHTGGTIDKLESIPGFKTSMSDKEFLEITEKVDAVIAGQSGDLAPCDKKLYALRDVTGTVESIPLIASSIMSKKLASGAKNIVLDVKTGSGAFMKTFEDSCALAMEMVDIGKNCNRNTAAVITNMDTPLGYAIGNSLEVIEAIEVLKGRLDGDLKDVSVELSAVLMSLCFDLDIDETRKKAERAIYSGDAFLKLKEMVASQGGDVCCLDDPSKFKKAEFVFSVLAERDGFIEKMDAQTIGEACVLLGAGRSKKEDEIDHAAGIILKAKTGDFVKKGEPLAELYTSNEDFINDAKDRFLSAITIGDKKPSKEPLIYKIIR